MLETVFFIITLLGLAIASYTDIKQRLVANSLVYAMAFLGICLKLLESVLTKNFETFFFSILGGAIGFGLAYALWKLGVWAGGDVKLITAICILNPINYRVIGNAIEINNQLFSTYNIPVFSATLIIYSALLAMPIGILMVLSASFKDKNTIEKVKEKTISKFWNLLQLAVVMAATKHVFQIYKIWEAWAIIVLLIFLFIPKNFKNYFAIIAGILALWLLGEKFLIDATLYSIPIMLLYIMISLYNESKNKAFKEELPVSKIYEGVIPDNYIVIKGKKLEVVEKLNIKRVINHLINNRIAEAIEEINPKEKVFASPLQAGGLSEEQVKEIKQKAEKGMAPKTITVKKTMAFVPTILIAYILLQLTGDLLWVIIF
jgi:preflagellin peptidase FlaK